MGCYPWSMLGKSRPGLLLLFTNREYSAAVRHHANFRGGGWWWWCWCPCSQLGDIGISITPDTRRLISESKNPILAILQRDSIDRQKYPCSFVPKRFLLWPRNSENFWSECVRIERRVWKQELLPRRQSLAWTWWQLLLGPQSYETDTSYCCLSFLFFLYLPSSLYGEGHHLGAAVWGFTIIIHTSSLDFILPVTCRLKRRKCQVIRRAFWNQDASTHTDIFFLFQFIWLPSSSTALNMLCLIPRLNTIRYLSLPLDWLRYVAYLWLVPNPISLPHAYQIMCRLRGCRPCWAYLRERSRRFQSFFFWIINDRLRETVPGKKLRIDSEHRKLGRAWQFVIFSWSFFSEAFTLRSQSPFANQGSPRFLNVHHGNIRVKADETK